MNTDSDRTAALVPETLARELQLVREAIGFVSSGGAARVVVGGIRFGEALLPAARQLALEAHVRVVPLWTSDEAGIDLAVERGSE